MVVSQVSLVSFVCCLSVLAETSILTSSTTVRPSSSFAGWGGYEWVVCWKMAPVGEGGRPDGKGAEGLLCPGGLGL